MCVIFLRFQVHTTTEYRYKIDQIYKYIPNKSPKDVYKTLKKWKWYKNHVIHLSQTASSIDSAGKITVIRNDAPLLLTIQFNLLSLAVTA